MAKYRVKEYIQESNDIWFFVQKKLWWWPWYYCPTYRKYQGHNWSADQTYGYKTERDAVLAKEMLEGNEKA